MNNGGSGANGGGPNNVKPDIFADHNATPLNHGEDHYFRSIIAEEDQERMYEEHCENAHRKMWMHFQAAAASLTHLYRERDQLHSRRRRQQSNCDNDPDESGGSTLWAPFQTAAGNLTHLYRESWDNLLKSGGHVARKSGYQKARRELASWARSKRRSIRREELLAVLASMSNGPFPRQCPVSPPLLGVEDFLQAASVTENSSFSSEPPVSAAAAVLSSAAAAVSDSQPVFRSLKRQPTPTLFGLQSSGRTTPSPNSDVNMSEHYSPVFKKPRQT